MSKNEKILLVYKLLPQIDSYYQPTMYMYMYAIWIQLPFDD